MSDVQARTVGARSISCGSTPRRGPGRWAIRAILTGALALSGLALTAGPAAALSDFTWSGATSSSSSTAVLWSNPTNWAGTAPSGSVGTLNFPDLTSSACTSSPHTDTCYSSYNDLTGLSASAIDIDDGAGYSLSGHAVAVGSGGITASPGGSDSTTTAGNAWFFLPLTLTADQTWSVTGSTGLARELLISGAVSGSSDTLGIDLSTYGQLMLQSDAEVGAVTITGTGSGYHGAMALSGDLNASDGNPVTITGGVTLFSEQSGTLGPTTLTDGGLQVGAPTSPSVLPAESVDDAINVDGSLTLNSTSDISMFVNQDGTVPGSDYSQLTATGDITLGGSALGLSAGLDVCPQLDVGDVLTLITTSGTLNGTFSDAADGATLPVYCGGGTEPTVRINYSSDSVTATVLTAGSGYLGSNTALAVSPSNPVTNQTVTLTATVTPNSATPAGTVTFDSGGAPISGCTSVPVSESGSHYIATCQTSFSAASSPAALMAKFTSSSTSLGSSSSPSESVGIGKSGTATALAPSESAVSDGQSITYTATVTPSQTGSTPATGSVSFLDGGVPIADCTSEPLIGGFAYCTETYTDSGSHQITADYSGDTNFLASDSGAQTVTIEPPAPTNTTAPVISGTPTVGQVLTETHGTWANSPTGYAYQWEDCNASGAACTAISGATGQTYTLTAADAGDTIVVAETASNAGGTTGPADSAPTAVVQALPASSGGGSSTTTTTPSSTSTATAATTPTSTTSTPTATGTGPSSGSGATTAASLDVKQISQALSAALSVPGAKASLADVLKANGYATKFAAPTAGRLVVDWYATIGGKKTLIASGTLSAQQAGTGKVTVKLTKAGRALLERGRAVSVAETATFTPVTGKAVKSTGTVKLKR